MFFRFRAHAQICVKNCDENRLEQVLQMSLGGARQAKCSFARVVHDSLYLDRATCRKTHCGWRFVPLPGGPHVFLFVFGEASLSVWRCRFSRNTRRRRHLKGNEGRLRATKACFFRFRAHAHFCRKKRSDNCKCTKLRYTQCFVLRLISCIRREGQETL